MNFKAFGEEPQNSLTLRLFNGELNAVELWIVNPDGERLEDGHIATIRDSAMYFYRISDRWRFHRDMGGRIICHGVSK